MKISEIMNTRVSVTAPDMPFVKLLRTMRGMPSRLLHVVDEGSFLGVISNYDMLKIMLPFYIDSNLARAITLDEDFAKRMLEENKELTAKEIMVANYVTLNPDSHFVEAEALFKEKAVNALPVVDDSGRLVGELTRKAMLAKLIDLCGQVSQVE